MAAQAARAALSFAREGTQRKTKQEGEGCEGIRAACAP